MDKELTKEGYKVSKIINYTSSKITDLNSEKSMDLIKKYPANIALIYSKRSAESFDEIVRKYLAELMTHCIVMCISKIEDFFKIKRLEKN